MNWDHWYQAYADSPSLQARLRIVCQHLAATLGQCAPGPIRVLSLCAGDGRDLIEVLPHHGRRADVRAWLIDAHPESIARGRRAAAAAGLQGQLQFRQGDAGQARSYADIGRVDVVIISGFLGHLHHEEARRLIASLPMLLEPGGWVIWSRHLVMNDGRGQVPTIQALLHQRAFAQAHVDTTAADGFAVGRARFTGAAVPLDTQHVLFRFPDRTRTEGDDSPRARSAWGDVEQSIPACLARGAAEYPKRTAIDSRLWQPSYEELNAVAGRVAGGLVSGAGVPGDRVAILMHHDAPLVAAILGVLKAGRVVVVLNPTDPPHRLEQILDHAEPGVILTDHPNKALAQRLARGRTGLMCFEDHTRAPARDPDIPIDPGDLAWLIHTSGSTGTPKLVMQTHRNIIHNALRNAAGLRIETRDRVVLLASPSGGQGVGTIWSTLLRGATLCPFPAMQKGVNGLALWMHANRISVYVSAASIFRNFTKTLDPTERFPDVRIVRLASEPATFDDFGAFRRHFPNHAILLQTLSSSETGNITQCRMAHDEMPSEGRLPVGKPAEGIDILLCDPDGHEVAAGEGGEIVVRSRYLSPGYWRNEKLTGEKFSGPDPATGLRQYHTGDLARRLPDGGLLFLGRKDSRVKIHGFRVEVSEIEAALERQPAVARAVIKAQPCANDEVRLAAYVELRPGQTASAETLRAALAAALPGYMIPSSFVFLKSFPLTAHGKVDRTQLPA